MQLTFLASGGRPPQAQMSSDSGSSRKERAGDLDKIEDGHGGNEDNDSTVELIDTRSCGRRALGMVLVVGLAVVFLLVGAGALIYAINKNEKGSSSPPEHIRDVSKNFTIFVNEFSATGLYSVTYRGYVDNLEHRVETSHSSWYQNDETKRLRHQLDDENTVLLYPDYSFWLRTEHGQLICDYDTTINYDLYIERFGLQQMESDHSEIFSTDNHKKIYVYNGHPKSVCLHGTDESAFLVRAYADSETGALLGWDTYFGAKLESEIFMTSYWFDDMLPIEPPEEMFEWPKECVAVDPVEHNCQRKMRM